MRRRLTEGHALEWIALVIFVAAYVVLSFFHEPWFDEAQAWQLARCSSLKELLFEIPHYEGHPPFWWLILAIPAKLGVPFEIGLKTIGFIISFSCAAIMLFRSKLPQAVRLALPFSFFFFYQYGIIVRPYGLMLLLMMILGQLFEERNEKPWLIVVTMMLLCLTSAYGIVIAGGISICIVYELLREKKLQRLVKELFTDARTASLFALLLLAIMLLIEIFPRSDTWVTSANGGNSVFVCLLCTLFTFLGDCLLTDSHWFRTDTVLLQNAIIPIPDLIANCLIGILLLVFIISLSSKKNLKFFAVPYVLFTAFSAVVYVSAHHLGIALMILLFWLEVNARDSNKYEIGKTIVEKIAKNEKDKTLLKKAGLVFTAACLLVPCYWTISAYVREIKLDYSYGRSASSFLQENNMEKCLILSSWGENSSKKYGELIGQENYLNTYENGNPVLICAYLDHNIFLNLGDGSDHDAYMHYRMADYETSQKTMELWSSFGEPEVLIGKPKLEALYGDVVTYEDYSLVSVHELNYVWKNKEFHAVLPIFLRNDLLDDYNLEPLSDVEYVYINGLRVTDEMRQEYENGVPVEDILKPYLDELFGTE